MNEELKAVCEDFLYYEDIIRAGRVFSGYRQLYPLCSYIYLAKRQEPNDEMIRLCREIIRENTSFFSYFRGNGQEVFITELATEEDPGRVMKLALAAYDFLREYFASSSYLPFLALTMARLIRPEAFAEVSARAKDIYELIRSDHFWLTGQEDVVWAGLLAMKEGRTPEEMRDEMEYCFTRLTRGDIFHHNAIQTVSHALTLCAGRMEDKCDNLQALTDGLEACGIQFSKNYEQASLAILANLGIPLDEIINDFCAVDDFLSVREGYGFWGHSRKTRYMHDVMILSAYHMNGSVELTTAVTLSALLEIQAEQAAAASAA